MTLPTPKPGTGLMTIAFDLDGTLAEPTWPNPWIGAPIEKAVDALVQYNLKGYELIIFTSRPASHIAAIRDWLDEHNLAGMIYDIVTDKPRAAMYVDDRAVAFPEAFEDGWVSPTIDITPSSRRFQCPFRWNCDSAKHRQSHVEQDGCFRHSCKPVETFS